MTRLADPTRCPDCRARLTAGSLTCGSCDLDLSGPLGHELFATLAHADTLIALLRQRSPAPPTGRRPAPCTSAPAAPASPAAAKTRLRSGSVPQILLGLGALCLLVAALVFLAVTWSRMGIGGRTATLVVLTGTTAALTAWAARRALRAAVEALGAVSLGLAVLDLYGADAAGWLGHPSEATMTVVAGAMLVLVGLAATRALLRTRAGGFAGGELATALGAALGSVGLAAQTWAPPAALVLSATVLTLGLLGAVVRLARPARSPHRIAVWALLPVLALDWLALVGIGLDDVGPRPTAASAWAQLDSWPMLAAAAVALLVGPLSAVPVRVRVAAVAAGLLPLALTLLTPALDEPTPTMVLAVTALSLPMLALLVRAPTPWSASGVPCAALAAFYLAVQVGEALEAALARYVATAGAAWGGTATGHLPHLRSADPAWLLPVGVLVAGALVAAALHLVPSLSAAGRAANGDALRTAATSLVAAVAVATLLLLPVPVWTVVAAGLAATIAVGRPAVTRGSRGAAYAGGAGLLATTVLSGYDEHLTVLALSVGLGLATVVHVRSRDLDVLACSGALGAMLLAGLTWTVGTLADLRAPWTGLAVLVALAVAVLARPAVTSAWSTVAAAPTADLVHDLAAALSAALAASTALAVCTAAERPDWTAVYLTVAGATAAAQSLLRPDRRPVAWLGGALLVGATWVRLADLGVAEPEPYTLPTALLLLVVGLRRLRRDHGVRTSSTLGAGLGLALSPSLLWTIGEPGGLRPVLLGAACLGLVLVGARLRWAAPLAYGAAAGAALVVREAAPYLGDTVPRWGLIGAAGAVLIALGVTWEQRLVQARLVSSYLRDLR